MLLSYWSGKFASIFARFPFSSKLSDLIYAYTFISKSIILISGLFNSILLARGLGASGRGEIAAIMLWPTILVYIGGLGLTEATFYFGTQKIYNINAVYTASILFTLVLSIIVIPLGYVILPPLLAAQRVEVVEMGRAFLLLIPIGMILGHLANLLRAQLHLIQFNILTLIVPIGSTLGAAILILVDGLMPETIIAVHLLLSILGLLYASYVIFRNRLFTNIQVSFSLMIAMVKYGLKVHIGTVWSLANLRLDQILLPSIVSPTQLGFYVVAVKVSSISSFLTNVVTAVAVPRIAHHAELAARIKALTQVFSTFWWLSILLKTTFLFILPFALPLLYGEEFSSALSTSIVLVFGSLFLDAKTLLTGGAQILNSPWLGSKAEILSSIFTIVLLITLIPTFGIMGAAIASLIAYGASLFVLLVGLKRDHNLSLAKAFAFNMKVTR